MSRLATAATTVSHDARRAILDHARETYPFECCGALIGRADTVHEVLGLPNNTGEGPRTRFLVTPEDYRRAEGRASERHLELIGFYHSHPDHPARPSQYDLDHAWPNFLYIIVSVTERTTGDFRGWRLASDRSAFGETAIANE